MSAEACWRCGAVMRWLHGTWQCGRCRFKVGCCEGEPQTACDAAPTPPPEPHDHVAGIEPRGQTVDGAVTRSVGAEDSDPEPNSFVAVTRERTRQPRSSPVSVYEDEAARRVSAGRPSPDHSNA
jgi:hypothetical protein